MRKVTLATVALYLLLGGVAAARADDAADAHAIIDKAIKATGGADKLKKITCLTSKLKGKVTTMGMDLDLHATTSIQEPDRIRIESAVVVAGQDFKLIQIFNKNKGWIVTNDETTELDADGIAAIKERLYRSEVNRLVTLGDKEFKLSTLGESKVDGKDAVGVHVERKGHLDYNLFFDKSTHLLIKTEGREKEAVTGAEVNSEVFISNYKDVDGVKMPGKLKVLHDGKEYLSGDISDQKFEDKLSDSLFEKP